MNKIDRRGFGQELLGSLLTVSLLRGAHAADALTTVMRSTTKRWIVEIEHATTEMRQHKMTQVQWQDHVKSLMNRVELNDLLRAIDYETMAKRAIFPDDHESTDDVDFSDVKGLPAELSFNPYLYAMHKDVSIVPHGHRNMSSMHMLVKGQAHARHYERVATEKDHLVIKPTSDKALAIGEPSTISDDRDNIHWFKALSEPVFMFSVAVFRIEPDKPFEGRGCIDPLHGEKQSNGNIIAPRIDLKQAYKVYGPPA